MSHLINPIEQNFSCNSCGLCCKTPWKIKVAGERAAGIRTTRVCRELEAKNFVPLPVVNGEFVVGRDQFGACRFLQSELCSIHAEAGAASKPTVCQLYPYSLVKTPDGHFVSLSFSCPSVLKGEGASVESQLGSIEETMRNSSYYDLTPMSQDTHVPLTMDREISWEEYKELEALLLEELDPAQPMKSLLRLAALVFDWKAEHGDLKPETFQQIVHHFPLTTACAVATLENLREKSEREAFADSLLDGERLYSHRIEAELPEFELLNPKNEEEIELVRRFLHNQILGKQLIAKGTVVSGLLRLAVALAIVFYYLKARESVEPFPHGDLTWCFRLVETTFVGHSDEMEQLFQAFEIMIART